MSDLKQRLLQKGKQLLKSVFVKDDYMLLLVTSYPIQNVWATGVNVALYHAALEPFLCLSPPFS